MTANRKIKNARKCIYNNIHFKSNLEMYCYRYFSENGITLQYETKSFVLTDAFYPKAKIYVPVKTRNSSKTTIKLKSNKVRPITYTPDFIFETPNSYVFIETKGRANDVYPIKRKLFLKVMNQICIDSNKECWFFEPHNQQQVRNVYIIIQNNILNNG